jgi:uncharacterized membrane protein
MTRTLTLFAATIATGLMAGLFFAYTTSVMPGLRRADDRTLVTTMQRINVAILNGWFLVVFLGAFLLSALAVVLHLRDGAVLPWAIAGLVLYGLTLAITFGFNIPLNNQLDAAGDPSAIVDLAAARARFEVPWVRWNLARTATSLAAFLSLATALLRA